MISQPTRFSGKFLLLLLCLILPITLTACGSTDPLYGSWLEPNSGVQLEIRNNGEIKLTMNGSSFTLHYTLEVPDKLILAASKDGSVPEIGLTYVATADSLTLTAGGVSTVFTRMK